MKRKDRRDKKLIFWVAFLVLFCSLSYPVTDTYATVRFDGMTIGVTGPNPFPCPGQTTVEVAVYFTYTTKPQPQRKVRAFVKLYQNVNWGSDIKLETIQVPYMPVGDPPTGFKLINFVLKCDTCCLGGITVGTTSTGEKEVELYAYYKPGGKYPSVYPITVRCQHPTKKLGTIPNQQGCVGDTADNTFLLRDTLASVQTADFDILYDSSLFSIVDAEIFDTTLAPYQVVDYSVPGIISFYSQLPGPADIYPGTLATFTVSVSDSAAYQLTQFGFDTTSAFLDSLGDTLGFDWDIGYFGILPADSTPPYINEAQIVYNPKSITGMPGAITDDYDSLQNYLHTKFYDDRISHWSHFYVDSIGGFLAEEIWLSPSDTVDLIAYDLVGNEDTVTITMQSHLGHVSAFSDTMGQAGDTVDVNFHLLNWSYSTHTYDLQVTDSEGWNLSPPPASVVLDSMQNTTITISATIPPDAPEGTINWITMTSTSQADSTITDSDSLYVEVTEEVVIPTLSEWGLIILALLLLAVGTTAVILRRRAVTAGEAN